MIDSQTNTVALVGIYNPDFRGVDFKSTIKWSG